MFCAACGADSPAGKRFCGECGAALSAGCPQCGAPAEPGKRFCGDCGAPLAAASGLPRPSPHVAAPLAERRLCSVLFCDLVEFTPLSETRDPEEVRELLSHYFETARTVIGRYGGVVEKFIGDAVMAVWGAPTASEGDAERAVRAAIELVEAVAELGREIGTDRLVARAGVVTGEVAVTVGAVGQGMVAGDAVNTAARVQAAAEPGGVLVDEATWRIARGAITFAEAGEHALKGKAEPMSLWRAKHVVSGAGGSQRIDGLEAPMVGRDAELRLIKSLFHASADRGTARLVSVIGPAGVGKSRLGWEFFKYIDGLATLVAWHQGRCLSYGDGVAFWALAEMVRQRLGIAEEDSVAVAAEKLDAGLIEEIPDPSTRDYVRPRVARLLGVETDEAGTLSREELFAGWRTFFEQIAHRDPVVMLIEDLHHADTGLLDFLEHLLDWSRDAPIFVLTLARPELEDRRPGWGSGRRTGTSLNLEPLDGTAMDAMIDGLVAGMPHTAKAAVAAQAQGIPLYAVETVRMLIDRDVVQPIEGMYRLVGDIGQLAVPDTLQSLLAARLDALDPAARNLVAHAAVLGGTFPLEALAAVSGMDVTDVRTQLNELVRREVMMVRADPLSPERGQYGFVQTMFRQVAYETLSRRERKARHLTVADHLSRVFADEGEEVAEVIAQHLLDALTAVPDDPDVPVLRRRAVGGLTRAAERATRTGAPAVAARALQTAANLLLPQATEEDDLEAAGLLERAGRLFREGGEPQNAIDGYGEARAAYERQGRMRLAARAAVGIGATLRGQSRHTEARPILKAALEVLSDEPDEDTIKALEALAVLETFAANLDEAQRLSTEAFNRAQALGLAQSTYVPLFLGRAMIHDASDRHVQAVAAYREASRLAELTGSLPEFGRANLNLADSLLAQGWWSEAIEAAQIGVSALRRVGASNWAFATGNLLQALILAGRWDEAQEIADASAVDGGDDEPYFAWLAQKLGLLKGDSELPPTLMETVRRKLASSEDPQDRMTAATAECEVAAARGDHRRALEYGMLAIKEGERVGIASEGVRWCWPLAADAALALDQVDDIEALLGWCDAKPDGHLHPIVRADRLRIRARLLARSDDPQAGEMFARAMEALRALGSPYHLAIGLVDHATFCARSGDQEAAQRLSAEAQVIAERLRAQPLLDRIATISLRDVEVVQP